MVEKLRLFLPSSLVLQQCSYAIHAIMQRVDEPKPAYTNSIASDFIGVPYAIHRALFDLTDDPTAEQVGTVASYVDAIADESIWTRNTATDIPLNCTVQHSAPDILITLSVTALFDVEVANDEAKVSTYVSEMDHIIDHSIEQASEREQVSIVGAVSPDVLKLMIDAIADDQAGGYILRMDGTSANGGDVSQFSVPTTPSFPVKMELFFSRGFIATFEIAQALLPFQTDKEPAFDESTLTVEVAGDWHAIREAISPFLSNLAGIKVLSGYIQE